MFSPIIKALEGVQTARKFGSTEDERMAEGRVLDALKALPMEGWADLCAALAKGLHDKTGLSPDAEKTIYQTAREEIRQEYTHRIVVLEDECRELAEQRDEARDDRRITLVAAALSGICSHASGPTAQAGEYGKKAHARWAIEVADAAIALLDKE